MGANCSLSRFVNATMAAGVVLFLLSSCKDDFGYHNLEGERIAFKLTAPDSWYNGMSVDENAQSTKCTSVQALSGGDTKLYLHTVVADNPAVASGPVTRGTPVNNLDAFKKTYSRFSLSGICYTGEYPSDEANNMWTTEYAHNLIYSTESAEPVEGVKSLYWPSNGNVRFFAFAPTVEDFNKLNTGGSLEMSDASHKGSPTLTYTVPEDVKKQVDLMAVCAPVSATITPQVDLKFGHALTAVQIKCGEDMLAGTITEVSISGVYCTGTQTIGSDKWVTTSDKATYTIKQNITLPADDSKGDIIHTPEGTPIAGTGEDGLTFMLMPQTVPDGASITIKFKDEATDTERTLTCSIAGHKWPVGKILTYTVSPKSIHISAKVELSKKPITADAPGDTIPYSGVWYDATWAANVEITQAGVEGSQTLDIPADKVKLQYNINGTTNWVNCTTNDNGLLTIAAQPAYKEMNSSFDKTKEYSDESSPTPLLVDGKSANCYMVDKAGYYSLPLVYGNGTIEPTEKVTALKYYPKHDDTKMTSKEISGVEDAVLLWQDAPDLIDPSSVKISADKKNLVFHIRQHTLAQGNAVVAVRDNSSPKKILWSWHIWVTPYKSDFYSSYYESKPDASHTYKLAKYYLGWCDSHDHNDSRKFKLQAAIDMSAYGGSTEETEKVVIGEFTQCEFRGSNAGDNTYYQWGRKDPMLGGIYNSKTPKYTYDKKGVTPDTDEFTMENKQIFNQYNEHEDGYDYDYSFCKNEGDMINSNSYESKGVSIGYTIQHPYMFITNSTNNDVEGTFDYRNHWHIPFGDISDKLGGHTLDYMDENTIMFNAWNAGAENAGDVSSVTKSVYDPCPPGFKMPPVNALKGLTAITNLLPLTGVRNYALRSNEWKTVEPSGTTSSEFDYKTFYKTSMPAFQKLVYITSAVITEKTIIGLEKKTFQVRIFSRDIRPGKPNGILQSSNSYGLTVLPMKDE